MWSCDWILSLSLMFSKFVCVVPCIITSFLLIAKYSTMWIYRIYVFIHLLVDIQIFFPIFRYQHDDMKFMYFTSFGYIPRYGIDGSYSNSIFNFLRNCQAIFYYSCTILHFCQQCMRVPIFLCPHQHLFISLLIIVILVGVKQYLIMILIFISVMTNNV